MASNDQLRKVFSLLDLTNLNDNDNAATIAALCHKAHGSLGQVAAVCVYPVFVPEAIQQLTETSIKVATVANFPHGTDSKESVLASITQSLKKGASEIDVVFPYKRYLQGNKSYALDMVTACKNLVGKNIVLKVILETGVIDHLSLIETISREVITAGADFLKTSTGKVSVGATLEAASVMLYAIKESGANVGFKASGGVRTFEEAMVYVRLAEDIMGEQWVTPAHFRIGTSGLANE